MMLKHHGEFVLKQKKPVVFIHVLILLSRRMFTAFHVRGALASACSPDGKV
jgi:hypothetical protein